MNTPNPNNNDTNPNDNDNINININSDNSLKARLWGETVGQGLPPLLINSSESNAHFSATDGFHNALVECVWAQLRHTARAVELLAAHRRISDNSSDSDEHCTVGARDWAVLRELQSSVDSDD